MKLQVKECKPSFKFDNMYMVKYEVVKENFKSGEKITSTKTIFSDIKLEAGENDVVISTAEVNGTTRYWISAIKEPDKGESK